MNIEFGTVIFQLVASVLFTGVLALFGMLLYKVFRSLKRR